MNIQVDGVNSITKHSSDVNCVAFSDEYLATGSGDKTMRLWNIDSFTEASQSPFTEHTYYVNQCCFSMTGDLVATCSTDTKAIIYDVQSGNKLCTLIHPTPSGLRSMCFTLNGQILATGGEDGSFCLWCVASKSLLRHFPAHDGSILGLAFSPDSRLLVSGSTSGDLRVWDCRFPQNKASCVVLDGHDLGVSCCTFPTFMDANDYSVTYSLTTGGYDDLVKIWTLAVKVNSSDVTLKVKANLKGHSGPVFDVCYSNSGQILASCSGDHTVRLWNSRTYQAIYVLDAHSRYVTCCAFSNDDSLLATGSNDRLVRIWKLIISSPEEIDKCDKSKKSEESAKGACAVNLDSIPPLTDPDGVDNLDFLRASHWSVDQTVQYLNQYLKLSQYVKVFYRHAIDGATFLSLTDTQLRDDLSINAMGHRRIIMDAVKHLQHMCSASNELADHPNEFLCPITHEIMHDPVIAADGYTYERSAIEAWFSRGGLLSPMTNQVLEHTQLVTNQALRTLIRNKYSHRS